MPTNKLRTQSASWRTELRTSPKAFSLIELLVVIALIGILTAGAIPSFGDFSRSQALVQVFKDVKTNLRVSQSRSLSGATENNNAKSWGMRFVLDDTKYTIFNCNIAQGVSDYSHYFYGDAAQCPSNASFKSVNLPANVKISSLGATPVDIVFHSPDGTPIVNGQVLNAVYTIGLNYINGGSPATEKRVKLNPSGGIADD